MYCSRCKTENEDSSNFCAHCGHPLAMLTEIYSPPKISFANQTTIMLFISFLFTLSLFYGIGYYFNFGIKERNQPKRTELCDRIGVLKQCNDMIIQGDARSCINLSDRFFEACGDYSQLHRYRNSAARRLSEWKIALDSADKLIDLNPLDANSHFLRANTHNDMGDYQSAIKDFEQTLALMPGEIQTPFELANLYQKVGKPCLGISPLERFTYHHPNLSDNAENILKNLYSNPICSDMQGNGKAKIRISKNGKHIKSKVIINEKYAGNFIVDTGASLVVLSTQFADRIKLAYSNWPGIVVQTANGMTLGKHGFIDKISLEGVDANHIEVVIQDEIGSIDGLLGLSFLNRFKIEMDSKRGYLLLTKKDI